SSLSLSHLRPLPLTPSFSHPPVPHLHLPSFPTRRSSDLVETMPHRSIPSALRHPSIMRPSRNLFGVQFSLLDGREWRNAGPEYAVDQNIPNPRQVQK